jgi:hypothetical protein
MNQGKARNEITGRLYLGAGLSLRWGNRLGG